MTTEPTSGPSASAAPWRAGLATGIGSLPGTDPLAAAAFVAGELPDLPHLVELPGRGYGADMIGRALAICVDLPSELAPTGWRLARRPSRDGRRAADFLSWDLDAAEQQYAGASWLKVQVAGPWTLTAEVETPRGHRVVTDTGAMRDIADSLAEGIGAHVAELARRLPGTNVVIQIDEPSLPAVLAGSLTTASGLGRVPPVPAADVEQVLTRLVAGFGGRPSIAHCCHPAAPIAELRRAGFDALAFDMSAGADVSAARLDAIGEAVEAGAVLLAGLVPTLDPAADLDPPVAPHDGGVPGGAADFRTLADPLLQIWHRLGLPDQRLAQVVVTPTCGLAGATPAWVRAALALTKDIAKLVAERAAA